MGSTPQHVSIDMNQFCPIQGASDGLPPTTAMPRPPPPPDSSQTRNNLGKIVFGLTFQAVLALFISPPTSCPPLLMHIFAAAMLISFALSLAALFLQIAYPRIALSSGKIGALLAAIGACTITSVLLKHQHFSWIPWLACGFALMAFILSFK
ncbi:hypothetical protein SDJN03_23585, partial [Cucurbita argyrosperma subsp. sororia]